MYRYINAVLSAVTGEFLFAGEVVARAYLQLLLLWNSSIGLLFMAGTWLIPQVGACGVLAVVTAYAFGRLVGIRRETWAAVNYLSNPLLVGLALGSILAPNAASAVLVAALSVLSFVLTVGMSAAFWSSLRLPVLTLPAAICILPVFSAAPSLATEPAVSLVPVVFSQSFAEFPLPLVGFLRSLGSILFLPHPLAGLFFAVVLLWRSRILLALAVGGYYLGMNLMLVLQELAAPTLPVTAEYNFPLVAMALGGLFFVPSWRSYLVAAAGVALTATILHVVSLIPWASGVSLFFLPFNLVTLEMVYALGCLGFSQIPRYVGSTPEETLQIDLAVRWRFDGDWRPLRLPFFGRWSVWQAFDGDWTHQGAWQYAYDFVIADERGRTFSGSGASLKDFYCYRRPVVSPAFGVVVAVVNDVVDNEPGEVNAEQNWGNRVVLYDDRGFYVQIAHLAQNSIRVAPGTRVEPGNVLGLCGNSGYSPQPHVHLQVQATAEAASTTLPFSLANCIVDGVYESRDRPIAGSTVEPLLSDPQLESRFEFLLGDELTYQLTQKGRDEGELRLAVRMAADGTMYFESDRGGRLYFGKRDGAFVLYRAEGPDSRLSLMLRALPRLPLGGGELVDWNDSIPASVAVTGLRRSLVQLLSTVVPAVDRTWCHLQRVGPDQIWCRREAGWLWKSENCRVELDGHKGPARITVESWTLTRRDPLESGNAS